MNLRCKLLIALGIVIVFVSANALSQTNPWGPPRAAGHDIIVLDNDSYMVGYSPKHKTPLWVAYHLPKSPGFRKYERPDEDSFASDRRVDFGPGPDDYRGYGYDRGHMAPSMGVFISHGKQAADSTFLMTNIVPQNPDLNRGLWAKLEREIALTYSRDLQGVWVVTGPIYTKNFEKLPSGVGVPIGFFKVVIDNIEGTTFWRTLSFMIPQEMSLGEDPTRYFTSIDKIEELTGLDLLPTLPDNAEAKMEAWRATWLWK